MHLSTIVISRGTPPFSLPLGVYAYAHNMKFNVHSNITCWQNEVVPHIFSNIYLFVVDRKQLIIFSMPHSKQNLFLFCTKWEHLVFFFSNDVVK